MTDKELQSELKKCNTLNEMWDVLDKFYNLDTPLGILTRPMAANQLAQRVETFAQLLSIKKR
jgi:hypothetical protein